MKDCGANKEEVWTALHRTIPYTIGYSLPAVTLTKNDCQKIMAPINKVGLSRSGIPSTIPAAIRNGPISMGGLGILDPYIHMGVSQIETLVMNVWQQTPTGTLISIALDDILLEMGITSPLTRDTLKASITYVTTPSWIRHVLHFMVEHGIDINIKNESFRTNRENDKSIMETALSYTTHAGTLQAINRVRMSLKVVWLSDILLSNGSQIDTQCLNAKCVFPIRNTYKWPLNHHTTSSDWYQWRKWINSLCTQNYSLNAPLGEWQCPDEEWVTPSWDCFVTQDREIMYDRTEDNKMWKRHIVQSGRNHRRVRYYKEYLMCNTIPEPSHNLYRASIIYKQTTIELLAAAPNHSDRVTRAPRSTLFATTPATKHAILATIDNVLKPEFLVASEELDVLLQDFSSGTIVAVSDGSHFPSLHRASAAWIVESRCRSQWIMGSMTTPGPTDSFNSYRSELTGLLGISVTIRSLANCLWQPSHCLIGCDGGAALQVLTLSKDNISSKMSNWDLISILYDIWASLTTKPFPIHIKGHQDSTGHTLNRLEQMNVIMDKLATMTSTSFEPRDEHWTISGVGMGPVALKAHTITGPIYKTLYHRLLSSNTQSYFGKSLFNDHRITNNVCWTAFQYARERSPLRVNIFISKWLSNTVGTGMVLQRRRHRIFNRCPRCNEWGEDRLHVLVCWDARATTIWNKGLSGVLDMMNREDTHPEITQFILQGLCDFHRSPRSQREVQQGLGWQICPEQIGWMNLLNGFISEAMVNKQSDYYFQRGSRKGGKQWAGKLILQFWTLIRNMWIGRNDVLHQKDIINSLSGEMKKNTI